MNDELHIVVAATRAEALAKLDLIADGRTPRVDSAGFRHIVTFEDLDNENSGYGREEEDSVMYCMVARF